MVRVTTLPLGVARRVACRAGILIKKNNGIAIPVDFGSIHLA